MREWRAAEAGQEKLMVLEQVNQDQTPLPSDCY